MITPKPSNAQLVLDAIKSLRGSPTSTDPIVTNLIVRHLKAKGIKHLDRYEVDEIIRKRFRFVKRVGYPTSYEMPAVLPGGVP